MSYLVNAFGSALIVILQDSNKNRVTCEGERKWISCSVSLKSVLNVQGTRIRSHEFIFVCSDRETTT